MGSENITLKTMILASTHVEQRSLRWVWVFSTFVFLPFQKPPDSSIPYRHWQILSNSSSFLVTPTTRKPSYKSIKANSSPLLPQWEIILAQKKQLFSGGTSSSSHSVKEISHVNAHLIGQEQWIMVDTKNEEQGENYFHGFWILFSIPSWRNQ